MSYRLLKVHWVEYCGEKKLRDLYSYHRSAEEVTPFRIRFERENNDKTNPHHYSIGCKGWVKVDGILFSQAKKSDFGIWAEEIIEEKQFA